MYSPEPDDINADISDAQGITLYTKAQIERVVDNLDALLDDAEVLIKIDPDDLYNVMKAKDIYIEPLGRGNFTGIPYEEGGGYRVHWGGDRILQYHPAERSHHGGAYFKVSSGRTGTIRINLQE